MSDDDYHIESADAGASATIPMEAGQIKKGGYVRKALLPPVVSCETTMLVSCETRY